MFFSRPSVITATLLVSAIFPRAVVGANQALMDCELKCSQRWTFPTPASSISPEVKVEPTSAHTPTSSQVHKPYSTPPPASTAEAVSTSQTESRPLTREHVAVASSPSPSNTLDQASATTRPTTTQTIAPTPEPTSPPISVSSSPDIDAYLVPHNEARAAHGAASLTWSNELAAAAQRWADNCVFEHSGGSLGSFGENLAAGSGDFTAQNGVVAWVDEAGDYNPTNPAPSHFTQVVWKGTTQVGCAAASCNLANFDPKFWPVKYHVCEYSSPGNVIGQFAKNVQA